MYKEMDEYIGVFLMLRGKNYILVIIKQIDIFINV